MLDDLAALRLQMEWGADEALLELPVDRLDREGPVAAPVVAAWARPQRAVVPSYAGVAPVLPGPVLPGVDAADLAALHAALDGLDHPLRATATMTVAPSGNPGSGLIVIAEAPGREDDRAGQAFSGAPGQALDAVLASAGLGRDSLLLTFLVPWRPPGGRDPSPAEIAACLPYLHRLLALTQPRRLVLLGQGPLRALTGGATVRQARGRWTEAVVPGLAAPVPALPMIAADQWRKTAANRQHIWLDLLTLRDSLGAV